LAEASQPPSKTDTPRSSCIIGRIGVKANRPMPIATASAASPTEATTPVGYASVLPLAGNGDTAEV